MPVPLERRRADLVAALAALRCRPDPSMPELALVHRWLDNWNGVGLIVNGMTAVGRGRSGRKKYGARSRGRGFIALPAGHDERMGSAVLAAADSALMLHADQ